MKKIVLISLIIASLALFSLSITSGLDRGNDFEDYIKVEFFSPSGDLFIWESSPELSVDLRSFSAGFYEITVEDNEGKITEICIPIGKTIIRKARSK